MSYHDIIVLLPRCQMQEMSYDVTAVLLAETFLAFDNVAYVLTCQYVLYLLHAPRVRTGNTVQVLDYVRTYAMYLLYCTVL